jgi:hypothetical protein
MVSQADLQKIEALIVKIESQVERLEKIVNSGANRSTPSKGNFIK